MGTRVSDVKSRVGVGGMLETPTGNEFHVSPCRCRRLKNDMDVNVEFRFLRLRSKDACRP